MNGSENILESGAMQADTEAQEPPENEQMNETAQTENGDALTSEPSKPVLTRAQEKKLAAKYLIFAGIALACVYLAQFFRFLAPVFEPIYYGNLTALLVSVCQAIFWIPCIAVLYFQIKRFTGFKVFRRCKTQLSLKRSLIIYACAVVPIFIVSAALGWELKVVFELGKRVTGMQLATNAVQYANGAVKLLLAIVMIELVQEAAELLYKGKYSKEIPWGGIALALIFGFLEVIVAYSAGTGSVRMFSWLYVAFDALYGVIYVLSKKNFFITFFVSLIIYIL